MSRILVEGCDTNAAFSCTRARQHGVYLWHWPVDLVLDRGRVGFTGWPLFAVQTAAKLAIAVTSYVVIEQPIRRGALSASQWRVLTPAVAVLVVIALVGSTLRERHRAVPVAVTDPSADAARIARTAPRGARRMMIIGNSVAFLLGASMQSIHTTPPLAVFNAAMEGCVLPPAVTRVRLPNADGTTYTQPAIPCHPSWEAGAVRAFRPAVVFWVMSDPPTTGPLGSGPVARTVHGGRPVQLHLPERSLPVEQDGVRLRPDGVHYTGPGGRIVARWLIEQSGAPN